MSTRLHAVREGCHLAPGDRTDENINDILDFVKDVKFFARLSILQQRSLCRTMTLEEFAPREFIFEMGELGDKFYIILSGSCGVQVPSQTAPCPNDVHSSEKCDCPNRSLETVVFLERGMGFGELALQSDAPRSATIQTSEKTELLVTRRADYETYAGQLHRQFIEQRVKFLRQCSRIEDALQIGSVTTQDIAAMANCLNEVNLSGNAVACRQGEVVDHMIFVRSGQLATLRSVDPDCKSDSNAARIERLKRGRSSNADAAALLPGAEGQSGPDSGDATKTENGDGTQPQWQLAQNLAKLMTDMKSRDSPDSDEVTDQPKGAKDQKRRGREPEAAAGSTESPETGGQSTSTTRRSTWKRLQVAMKTVQAVKIVDSLTGQVKADASKKKAGEGRDGQENVDHFTEVAAARKRYTQYTFRKLEKEKQAAKEEDREKKVSARSSGRMSLRSQQVEAPTKKRTRILRIGTLGPYQYFGDKQLSPFNIGNNETFPFTLVSDPVADIYVMSKHDIQRRVPKKLFAALFSQEQEEVPSDAQLLDMHKQTERWNAYRKSMHGEALGNLNARSQMRFRDDGSTGNRIDAVANLDFLGVNPHSNRVESRLALPLNKGTELKPKDEELFSHVSARFLRRFDIMKRDPSLRENLARAGLMRNARLHDGLPGSSLDDDDEDPMAFRFEQHWYRLQKDPIGLDLEDDLPEDTSKAGNASSSNARSRPTVRMNSNLDTGGDEDYFQEAQTFSSTAGGDVSFPPINEARSSGASGAIAKQNRKSVRHEASGVVELPPITTPRVEGMATSRPPSTPRVVGFADV